MNAGAFLRSNGDLVCWDDAGCNTIIQAYDPQVDYALDVYLGPPYRRIREALQSGKMPHPNVCAACLACNPQQVFDPSLGLERRLRYLQVESSFACQLRCPNCYPGVVRKNVLPRSPGGHLNLKLEAYEKIIRDLFRAGVVIDVIEFQGHGEPLINPAIWDMVSTARELYPNCHIKIITNGNFEFKSHMIQSGLSEMIFSVDGIDQQTYDPYRRLGEFDKAYRFMKDFCSAVMAADVKIKSVWKYILFEHCSDPIHLDNLCALARAAQVDEVMFVITQMGPSSDRFFRALLDLREKADRDSQVIPVLEAMQAPVSASWLSGEFHRHLGYSPFPPQINHPRPSTRMHRLLGGLRGALPGGSWTGPTARRKAVEFRSVCYLSVLENLDSNLISARGHKEIGELQEVGEKLVALATKLWRLYEGRYHLISDAHSALMEGLLELVEAAPTGYQNEVFLKLECFAKFYGRGDLKEQKLHKFAISHIQTEADPEVFTSLGNDPSFILFPQHLRFPEGQAILKFSAQVLEGSINDPCLYYDLGRGFTEKDRIAVQWGELQDCRVRLRLPTGIARLRFDPGSACGRFRLGEMHLETDNGSGAEKHADAI